MLPAPLSRAVAIAYLVCRVADTIEDDSALPIPRRRELLATWRTAVQTGEPSALPVDGIGHTADEHALMRIADSVHRELHRLGAADVHAIARYAVEMIDGMSVSLAPRPDSTTPLFATQAELEQYCYYVAGTVGLMLTDLYQNHAHGVRGARLAIMHRHAVNFGVGLQLTNVIRDVGNDLAEGRVYFPASHWAAAGITPLEFLAPGHTAESWQVVQPLIELAERMLRDALAYSLAVPRRAFRIRLFCVVQLLFALRTLALVRRNAAQGVASTTVKMPRREVYLLLGTAALLLPSSTAIAAVAGRLQRAWRRA
ncbi:MAG: squalene/phytoene synthase family protein [Gemmatimonadales bacterium]|nr:squalene/phytoene synthase family protein [Gemmatimonadales bacterium]